MFYVYFVVRLMTLMSPAVVVTLLQRFAPNETITEVLGIKSDQIEANILTVNEWEVVVSRSLE